MANVYMFVVALLCTVVVSAQELMRREELGKAISSQEGKSASLTESEVNLQAERTIHEHWNSKTFAKDLRAMKQKTLTRVTAPPARSIPNRLMFNDRFNLILNGSQDISRAQNVNRILHMFPDMTEVQFLDNAGCYAAIAATHSKELAMHVSQEPIGMYQSDVCRLAQLAMHGGYYMDTDLELLQDMREILPAKASFASVIALPWKGPKNPNEMFQAFIGAAPRHPVVLSALDKSLEFYQGRNQSLVTALDNKMRGTILMRLAYEEWLNHEMVAGLQEKSGEDDFKYSYMLEEARPDSRTYPTLKPQVGEGNTCNIAVLDASQRKVLAYSHSVGSQQCK